MTVKLINNYLSPACHYSMKVAILGAATSKFGELWDQSPRQLARNVVNQALGESGLKITDIEALYVAKFIWS